MDSNVDLWTAGNRSRPRVENEVENEVEDEVEDENEVGRR